MKTAEFLNHTPSEYCGVRCNAGELFGVELELEGHNVALRDVATKGWERTHEPSLRGGADNSVEFTFSAPTSLTDAKDLVNALFKKFDENGVVFNNSVRTSTHVHLNYSDKSFKQVFNFFCLFTMMEEILSNYCGEDRKGNLFCISSRDAEGVVRHLSDEVRLGKFTRFAENKFKYAACNLSTLFKFGTVEVRTMRGASSAYQVNNWLDILNEMYKYSLSLTSPADLISDLSRKGAIRILEEVFSAKSLDEILPPFRPQSVSNSMMEGGRLLQVFAFEFDEAFKKEVKVKAVKHSLKTRYDFGSVVIYKPSGERWVCTKHGPGMFWQDGDFVADDERIEWNEERQRFIVRYPDGRIEECNWRRHPVIADEGAPRPLKDMPNEFPDDFEPDPDMDDFN